MSVTFINAWGYQGNAMNLPVVDVEAAIPFYTNVMGFELTGREEEPPSAILSRPDVQMKIIENGGDPEQDGVAFEVSDVVAVYEEFRSRGFEKLVDFSSENRSGVEWKVFFVVAPDGLCFWLGERISE